MGANLEGANLREASLKDAILWGANLIGVKNLTQEQVNAAAIGDEQTQLPEGLTRPAHWPPAAKE
jgi:uncharacterized protein YjbI with pentapeptide repeats